MGGQIDVRESTTAARLQTLAEEELTQPLRFERLARGPIAQRLRIVSPLPPPLVTPTFETRGERF